MPSRYHPIEDGLWDDPKFEASDAKPEAPGEERGFFAFLSSNKMQRPAGIYRATDAEISAASRIPLTRVKKYLIDLDARGLIVRDGAWIFCPGYWKRQAHNPGMMKAAKASVESCSSCRIVRAFVQRYPLHKEWFVNGCQTVAEPISEIAPTEQSRAEQYQSSTTPEQSKEPTALIDCESTKPRETPEALLAIWNDAASRSRKNGKGLPGLRMCRGLSGSRIRKAALRLKDAELEWHRAVIERLAKSSFACGGGKPTVEHPKPFRASFGWYIHNDENCMKASEGLYDD